MHPNRIVLYIINANIKVAKIAQLTINHTVNILNKVVIKEPC